MTAHSSGPIQQTFEAGGPMQDTLQHANILILTILIHYTVAFPPRNISSLTQLSD